METPPKIPRNGNEKSGPEHTGYTPESKVRDGGDDALSSSTAEDSNADEQVIVNEQKENKVVNAPSQAEALPGELEGNNVE